MPWSRPLKPLCAALVLALLPLSAAHAAPDKTADTTGSPAAVTSDEPAEVVPAKRDEVLGADWRTSADVAWTTSGDADGLHVLAARARDGYAWRTVTTLSEPGFDVDQWIGNACATGSGKRLVVVYAPRTFTNKADLFDRGGFTATVDLETGVVAKLPVQGTLAYYNPGCGTGEKAVVTQEGSDDLGRTRLVEVDAAAGELGKPVEVAGQLTSAISTRGGIVAADRGGVVTVDAAGARRLLAPSSSLPFRLKEDSAGGVVFLDHEEKTAFVRRADRVGKDARVSTLASGPLTGLSLASSAEGKVFVTGQVDELRALPASVGRLDVPKDSTVSTLGRAAVTSVRPAKTPDEVDDPTAARPLRVEAQVSGTGKQAAFTVTPASGSAGGRTTHPKLSTAGGVSASGSPTTPIDAEQVCAIARNDPAAQVYQPTARQVEWAVDYAVTGGLTIVREANWKQSGLPAWQPQQLFPSLPLDGGGEVPPQVLLGVLAQESNLWQAARFALPGVTANPLIGNFYGTDIYNANQGDDWDIRWDKADCGYGVSQATDGMRLAGRTKPGETALPPNSQKAVAVDFATNIAYGLQILQRKWNETRRAGVTVNDGKPQYLENWYFALWSYNSGFNGASPPSDAPWGVGWANNPANPKYDLGRDAFLETGYADAAHPERWPYQEKVLGWAGHPIESVEAPGKLVSGYLAAFWNGWREHVDPPSNLPSAEANRRAVKPPRHLFCELMKNGCDRTTSITPDKPDNPNTPEDESTIGEPAGPCTHRDAQGYYDLKCWWHYPATWKSDCAYECGHDTNRFRDPDVGYQPDGVSYPPNCRRDGLPSNAIVVDDVPTSAPPQSSPQRPCGVTWASEGTFDLRFGGDPAGRFPSKADFHQVGAGFGGHFWFSHTNRADAVGDKLLVTGTWTLGRQVNGWARVLVHLPDHGAHTQQAEYRINRGDGSFDKTRYLGQGTKQNRWVSLGVYQFAGTPQVRLDNQNDDEGRGVNDVAWDAVAFQPLDQKPKHFVAVLGDSYSSGEGAGDYSRESDDNHGTTDWAACRRSANAWGRKLVLPGTTQSLGTLSDGYSPTAELGFAACSGAKTWNITRTNQEGSNRIPAFWNNPADFPSGDGQFREIAQIESGVLDENTTLVALTIGGNDEDLFSGAVEDCSYPDDCATTEFLAGHKAKIDGIQPWIDLALTRIAAKAPNAQVVLIGYPKLVTEFTNCAGIGLIATNEANALGLLGDHMTAQQAKTVENLAKLGRKVHFADTNPDFTAHRACDGNAWIHGVRVDANGEGDFHEGDPSARVCIPKIGAEDQCLSRESFHLNSAGTSGVATLLRRKLDQIGYQGL